MSYQDFNDLHLKIIAEQIRLREAGQRATLFPPVKPQPKPEPFISIMLMSDAERKQLRDVRYNSVLHGLFISPLAGDTHPVKFYVKGSAGEYIPRSTTVYGVDINGVQIIHLPQESVDIPGGHCYSHFVNDADINKKQAIVELIGWEQIKKGMGINGAAVPKFKIVPVE